MAFDAGKLEHLVSDQSQQSEDDQDNEHGEEH